MAPKTRTVVREGVDVIASGGMDDIVRLWDVTPDGELKLKYKLSDHSLGVVSVALNKEVTRKGPFINDVTQVWGGGNTYDPLSSNGGLLKYSGDL